MINATRRMGNKIAVLERIVSCDYMEYLIHERKIMDKGQIKKRKKVFRIHDRDRTSDLSVRVLSFKIK